MESFITGAAKTIILGDDNWEEWNRQLQGRANTIAVWDHITGTATQPPQLATVKRRSWGTREGE